jgi:hypothetical protein
VTDVQYRDTTAGQGPGVEATWRCRDHPERAFAFRLTTVPETYLVSAEALADDEYKRALLPAYLLARTKLLTPRSGRRNTVASGSGGGNGCPV